VPNTLEEAQLIVDTAIQTVSYASRAAVHGTLKISPGSLVFRHDMFFDIPPMVDLAVTQNKQQAVVDKRLEAANKSRISADYQPGQQVLIQATNPSKLQPCTTGPYPITAVHTNGTVTIRRKPHVLERINIRRLLPFFH
jgi:hypothetical protein